MKLNIAALSITALFAQYSSAAVDFSWSPVITNEASFFSTYSNPVLVTDIYHKGDGSHPNSWIVRSSKPGFGFWEDLKYGNPYPLRIADGGGINGYTLSILEPESSSIASRPIAVYTDNGFMGFVPTAANDKFFQTTASEITAIYTVSAIPEPSKYILVTIGLALIAFRAKTSP